MKVYTPDEIAEMLKVSKKTVYYWINKEKLKAIKVGNMWRVKKEDLEEFIDAKIDDDS